MTLDSTLGNAVKPHVDGNVGASVSVGFGEYERGELVIEGKVFPTKHAPLMYDGNVTHHVQSWDGKRSSLTFFTHPKAKFISEEDAKLLKSLGFNLPSAEYYRQQCMVTSPVFLMETEASTTELNRHTPSTSKTCDKAIVIDLDFPMFTPILAMQLLGWPVTAACSPRGDDQLAIAKFHLENFMDMNSVQGRTEIQELVRRADSRAQKVVLTVDCRGPFNHSLCKLENLAKSFDELLMEPLPLVYVTDHQDL